jgi:hypothetical protein
VTSSATPVGGRDVRRFRAWPERGGQAHPRHTWGLGRHAAVHRDGAAPRVSVLWSASEPRLRVAGTSEVLTQDDIDARAAKQDVMTIGVELPGLPSEPMYRVGGTGEIISQEEADRRSARHGLTVQLGASPRDVRVSSECTPSSK